MGKGKSRHNPDKKQNNYGGDGNCSYFDEYREDGKTVICEAGISSARCNGNRHKCSEQRYRLLASVKPEKREFI